jgi:thiol-disulfide isomerase/thioredoxin
MVLCALLAPGSIGAVGSLNNSPLAFSYSCDTVGSNWPWWTFVADHGCEIPFMRATILMLILGVPAFIGQGDASDARISEEVRSLERDWARFEGKFRLDYDAASTDNDRKKILVQFEESLHSLGQEVLKLVRDHPGEQVAVDALLWLTRRGLRPESSGGWKILLHDHLKSDRFVPACIATRRDVVANTVLAERFLREAMAHTPHREVKGHATFALANFLSFQAEALEQYGSNPGDSWIPKMASEDRAAFVARRPDDLLREAERLFETVATRFPDLKDQRNRLLGELATEELYEMRHLGIEKASPGIEGKVAPDINGADADGRAFNLSEFRGKVVVLTFSGNWCGPCRSMYPEERELVTAFKDKPFALLSVNTDKSRETLTKLIATGEVTWRCWWDGEPGGPICTRWGVESFPTIYVLDHRGAIRFKAVGRKKLKQAVETLLNEAASQSKGKE